MLYNIFIIFVLFCPLNQNHIRHTDCTLERRDLAESKKEFTTQKLRQEWAEHEETIGQLESLKESHQSLDDECKLFRPIVSEVVINTPDVTTPTSITATTVELASEVKEEKSETKSKKKRRKKTALKKKNSQRKNSSSSSAGSFNSEQQEHETETMTVSTATATTTGGGSSSTDESPIVDESVEPKEIDDNNLGISTRLRDLDIHFFSDTEVDSAISPRGSRPSTPIQSDTEFEVSQREKTGSNLMTSSASWKWGELPTQPDEIKENITDDCEFFLFWFDLHRNDLTNVLMWFLVGFLTLSLAKQAQRNSMLSSMFSFMKQTKNMRKNAAEGLYLSDLDAEGMDPEVIFPFLA